MIEQSIWAPDNGSESPWQVTQEYSYDAVNRLATAAEKLSGVTQWSRTYSYDHFGNRWISGATGHTLHMATPTSSSDIQATTNRLIGMGITYHNAGNLTAQPYIKPGSSAPGFVTDRPAQLLIHELGQIFDQSLALPGSLISLIFDPYAGGASRSNRELVESNCKL